MEFKKKDKVKCIRDFYDMNGTLMTMKNEYYYSYISNFSITNPDRDIIWFNTEQGIMRNTDDKTFKKYFITLQEERKLKLKKLENENR